MVLLNGVSNLKQYFDLRLNGSKYYLMYTFKAFHVLRILDYNTSLDQRGCEKLHLFNMYQ